MIGSPRKLDTIRVKLKSLSLVTYPHLVTTVVFGHFSSVRLASYTQLLVGLKTIDCSPIAYFRVVKYGCPLINMHYPILVRSLSLISASALT